MKSNRDKKIEKAANEFAMWMKEAKSQCNCKLKIPLDLIASIKLRRERDLSEPDTRFEDSLPQEKTGWDKD